MKVLNTIKVLPEDEKKYLMASVNTTGRQHIQYLYDFLASGEEIVEVEYDSGRTPASVISSVRSHIRKYMPNSGIVTFRSGNRVFVAKGEEND